VTSGLATRVGSGPLLTRRDVPSVQDGFEVQAVLNPATAQVGDEIVLLIRVAERPRTESDPPSDARTLDLSGLHQKVVPLPSGYRKEDVVPIAVADPESASLRHIAVYLPRDLPGLDTSDPRGVTFTNPKLGKTVTLLTQVSHLRCARSRDGVHFTVDEQPSIAPSTHFEEYGCEDARATLIDGVWHITYVAVSRVGITPSLALTSARPEPARSRSAAAQAGSRSITASTRRTPTPSARCCSTVTIRAWSWHEAPSRSCGPRRRTSGRAPLERRLPVRPHPAR